MAGGVNKWIVANWKSNKTLQESLEWLDVVGKALLSKNLGEVKVVVCPTTVALGEMKHEIQVNNYPILLGAQNISPFGIGAYTGELPAELLKGIVDLTLVGHSERRQHFGETDEQVAEKVQLAQEAGLQTIVCVQGAETAIPEGSTVVAYEPVFAIGTGTPDTPDNANQVIGQIKQKFSGPVLYGGSVKAENVQSFLNQDQIDGLLIGGASLDPTQFITIIEQCLN